MTLPSFWRLERFGERLEMWAAEQATSNELINALVEWTLSRFDNPYAGVRREPQFANMWFGPVPGTVHGSRVVVCSYWIFEEQRTVRCDNYASLSLPI